jgi:hypothetical protein
MQPQPLHPNMVKCDIIELPSARAQMLQTIAIKLNKQRQVTSSVFEQLPGIKHSGLKSPLGHTVTFFIAVHIRHQLLQLSGDLGTVLIELAEEIAQHSATLESSMKYSLVIGTLSSINDHNLVHGVTVNVSGLRMKPR